MSCGVWVNQQVTQLPYIFQYSVHWIPQLRVVTHTPLPPPVAPEPVYDTLAYPTPFRSPQHAHREVTVK